MTHGRSTWLRDCIPGGHCHSLLSTELLHYFRRSTNSCTAPSLSSQHCAILMGQKDKNNALHLPEHHHLVSRESSGGILHSTSLGQQQGLSGAQNYVKVYGADTIGLQGRVCTPSRRGKMEAKTLLQAILDMAKSVAHTMSSAMAMRQSF